VDAERSFTASSGIDALAGQINTAGVQQLFSPHSNQALIGKGQSASNTQLQTSLAGQVVAVVSGGMLVVQAQHAISMNNEKQTIVVRGVARPGDIGPNNVVASTALANLEVEIKGKGVLSDANRQPNWLTRMILKLVGF
jgi:flagellar L-ring protein precursor FlgH